MSQQRRPAAHDVIRLPQRPSAAQIRPATPRSTHPSQRLPIFIQAPPNPSPWSFFSAQTSKHHDHAPCANNSSTRTIQPDLHHISTSAAVRSHQPGEEADPALLPHLQSTSPAPPSNHPCQTHLY
ncbi:hypothetical protein ACLOJK_034505 [Asimina triloba]